MYETVISTGLIAKLNVIFQKAWKHVTFAIEIVNFSWNLDRCRLCNWCNLFYNYTGTNIFFTEMTNKQDVEGRA